MQEEVTQGAVTLIINGAKISEQTLEKAIQKFLDAQKQGKLPKIHRGKQTLKQNTVRLGTVRAQARDLGDRILLGLRIEHTRQDRTVERQKAFFHRKGAPFLFYIPSIPRKRDGNNA